MCNVSFHNVMGLIVPIAINGVYIKCEKYVSFFFFKLKQTTSNIPCDNQPVNPQMNPGVHFTNSGS